MRRRPRRTGVQEVQTGGQTILIGELGPRGLPRFDIAQQHCRLRRPVRPGDVRSLRPAEIRHPKFQFQIVPRTRTSTARYYIQILRVQIRHMPQAIGRHQGRGFLKNRPSPKM